MCECVRQSVCASLCVSSCMGVGVGEGVGVSMGVGVGVGVGMCMGVCTCLSPPGSMLWPVYQAGECRGSRGGGVWSQPPCHLLASLHAFGPNPAPTLHGVPWCMAVRGRKCSAGHELCHPLHHPTLSNLARRRSSLVLSATGLASAASQHTSVQHREVACPGACPLDPSLSVYLVREEQAAHCATRPPPATSLGAVVMSSAQHQEIRARSSKL